MMAAAIDLAESIAQMSPVAIQGTKVHLNYSRDHSVEEGLEYIVSLILICMCPTKYCSILTYKHIFVVESIFSIF